MPVYADSNGTVAGKFTIPAGVLAGYKSVNFTGSGGSYGSAVFYGQGTLVENTMQETTSTTITETTQEVITNVTTRRAFIPVDPLAQTFSVLADAMIGGVDLIVQEKGAAAIVVQLRETQVGFPTRSVLAEARLTPAQMTNGAWNSFIFPALVRVRPDIEYAIVVLSNDPNASVSIAELGKWDSTSGRWVTSQPYQVGTLLSSSNASTWTAHQDRDLTFRLLAARFTEAERIIDLGTVSLTEMSEMVVVPLTENPSNDATSDLMLTFPDGSVVTAGNQQIIKMGDFTTGNVGIQARLRSSPTMSASLFPGSQVILGKVTLSEKYVSRAFQMDAGGSNMRVIFEAFVPSGAAIVAEISSDGVTWAAIPADGAVTNIGNGIYEYKFYQTALAWAQGRIRLTLSGGVTTRPAIGKLRVSIT